MINFTRNLVLESANYGIMSADIIPAPLSVSAANKFRRKACASPGGSITVYSYGIMFMKFSARQVEIRWAIM